MHINIKEVKQKASTQNSIIVRAYLASHLVARDWNEEEMSLIGVMGTENTITNVLKEIAFTGVLARKLSWGLVKSVGITIWVYIHLESPLHLRIIQPKYLRQMVNIPGNNIIIFLSLFLFLHLHHL